jgi:hypothetical protein
MNTDGIQASNRARSQTNPGIPTTKIIAFERLPGYTIPLGSAAEVREHSIPLDCVGYFPDAKPTFDATDLLALEDHAREAAELAKKAKFATDKTLAPHLLAVSKQLPKIAAKLATEAARLKPPARSKHIQTRPRHKKRHKPADARHE